ncbi:MAG: hypothetical protein KUG75_06290 [Pseudomonadales bacterium]|nr:hypothetical protein [Pseudomonadales bacterium]
MSSLALEKEVNLKVILEGSSTTENSRIDNSKLLSAFAEAIVGCDIGEIEDTRNALVAVMGIPAMIEAAGVASNFQRMVRIAESTGIPLGGLQEFSSDVRNELNLDKFLKQKTNL